MATPASTRHIPSLDGIRALSFLVVFAGHAGFVNLVSADLGVTVFFFLSGYLITTLLRSEFERNGRVRIDRFWMRRMLRILPPLYLVVLGAVLLSRVLNPRGIVSGSTLAAQLFFYANYEGIYGVNREAPGTGVVWSLAVEEHFYLLFPWLYVGMQKLRMSRNQQAGLLWALCVSILVWRFVLVLIMHSTSARIYLATDTRVDAILAGCALAVWKNPVLDEPWGTRRHWKMYLLPLGMALIISSLLLRGEVFRQTWYFSLQEVALTLLFASAIRFHDWPIFRLLNWKPVAFVGVLSYSLYLTHDVVLEAIHRVAPLLHGAPRAVVALLVSFAAASLIFVLIEKPCAELRRRLSNR